MPVTIERLPGEPILLATFSGIVTPEDVMYLYQQSAVLIGDETGVFHRITDTREMEQGNFADLIKNLQAASQELPASLVSKKIQVTFVGSSGNLYATRDYFLKRGIPTGAFEDVETALKSVRIRIESDKKQSPDTES